MDIIGRKKDCTKKTVFFVGKKRSGWAHSTCIISVFIIFYELLCIFACCLWSVRSAVGRFSLEKFLDHKTESGGLKLKTRRTRKREKRIGNLKKNMRQRVRKTPAALCFECFNRSTFQHSDRRSTPGRFFRFFTRSHWLHSALRALKMFISVTRWTYFLTRNIWRWLKSFWDKMKSWWYLLTTFYATCGIF